MPRLPDVVAERRRRAEVVVLPSLQRWRELRGLSRRQLAARAPTGHATIWRLELGFPARPATLHKLAAALDVDEHDLVG
jgi:transcriptional regulator with XRE-family HTH domain